jgi:thermitase
LGVAITVVSALLLLSSFSRLSSADDAEHTSSTDRLVISYSDGTAVIEISELADRHSASIEVNGPLGFVLWTNWNGAIAEEIARIKGVTAVEREKPAHISFVPNDQYYESIHQWGIQRINAEAAWDYVTGSTNITVAVLDTGVDYTHDDLTANMWKDGNGHFGHDFVNSDDDPMDDNVNGYDGTTWAPNMAIYHGTHVAGVVGAVMNNAIGIAGVAQVKIMAVKVMNDSGEGTDVLVSQGIQYAVDNGADIITMSLGVESSTVALENACEYAADHRVLLVAAAGNEEASSVAYPGAYPQVISVGATNKFDTRAKFSNYGSDLEIMAPGTDIYSTKPSDTYQFLDGTSTATPFVAGVAALMLSVNPGLTPSELRHTINVTAENLGASGWDSTTGWGIVDALAAVKAVSGPSTAIVDYPSTASPNETLTIKWVVTGTGALEINQTCLRWGYSPDALDHTSGLSYNRFTPSTFSANDVVAPNIVNGTLYLQSYAVINGTAYLSSVAHITVSESITDPFTNLLHAMWNFITNDIGLLNFIIILAILITVIVAAVAVRRSRRRARREAQAEAQAAASQSIAAASPAPSMPPAATPAPTEVPAIYVDISAGSLAPASLEIEEGARVVWRNTDWAPPPGISIISGYVDGVGPHPAGIFASGLMVSPGEYWSCIFNVQGVYSYYVSNTNINGRIVVRAKA